MRQSREHRNPVGVGFRLQRILTTLGYDVDRPWRELPKKDRDWILFTDEQPTVPVYAGYDRSEVRRAIKRKEPPSYQGTFTSARRYVMSTFSTTESASMKKRVSRYMLSTECPLCHGKRLRPESLSVTFADLDIAAMSRLPLKRLATILQPYAGGSAGRMKKLAAAHPEKAMVATRIAQDLEARLAILLELGLGYLTLERSTPTLSPGELQRLRLATQVRSNLFGVVYVLDEPSAGLHPADTEALLSALDRLEASGNSLFVVEHGLDVIRHADWIVDVGPGAGQHGGRVLYSGPASGLANVEGSHTFLFLGGRCGPASRLARRIRPRDPMADNVTQPRTGAAAQAARGEPSRRSSRVGYQPIETSRKPNRRSRMATQLDPETASAQSRTSPRIGHAQERLPSLRWVREARAEDANHPHADPRRRVEALAGQAGRWRPRRAGVALPGMLDEAQEPRVSGCPGQQHGGLVVTTPGGPGSGSRG